MSYKLDSLLYNTSIVYINNLKYHFNHRFSWNLTNANSGYSSVVLILFVKKNVLTSDVYYNILVGMLLYYAYKSIVFLILEVYNQSNNDIFLKYLLIKCRSNNMKTRKAFCKFDTHRKYNITNMIFFNHLSFYIIRIKMIFTNNKIIFKFDPKISFPLGFK